MKRSQVTIALIAVFAIVVVYIVTSGGGGYPDLQVSIRRHPPSRSGPALLSAARPARGPRRGGSPRRRALVAGGLLAAAVAAGVVAVAGRDGRPDEQVVTRFAQAWERGDTLAMYRELSPEARERTSLKGFARRYRLAAETATAGRP